MAKYESENRKMFYKKRWIIIFFYSFNTMEPGPYEKVPLTDEEKDMLLLIYRKRLRFFLTVNLILLGIIVFQIIRFFGPDFGRRDFTEILGMIIVMDGIPLAVISGTGLYVLFNRILPIKRDVDSGMKDKVPYQVIRKEHFYLTGQFYVALDDPDYLHHEIDEDTYHNLWEGCTIYLYRGTRSKYVFEENGRFTL
jgi:hypothetical protein